jgi:hypothetical protein
MGASFHSELHEDIHQDSLPPHLGGTYGAEDHITFEFDVGEGGLLHCPVHLRFDVDTKTDGEHVDIKLDADVSEVRTEEETTSA